MENEVLCGALEEMIPARNDGERALLREAARRLRLCDGRAEQVVELAGKLTTMQGTLDHLIRENERLRRRKERTLHLRYDLEEDGCGAVLWEGQETYCVSVLQLAQLLAARRDGRLLILPEEAE